MNMNNFASNLHQKGDLKKIEQMEKLAKKIELESKGNLAGAFLTNGVYNKYDVIAIIPNSKEYEDQSGYIFYDNEKGKAIYILDSELE